MDGYALHVAAQHKSRDGPQVMNMLINHGADPNARGGQYETALQAAAFHGCLTNIRFLLSVGAAPTIEGGQHESPLNASMAEEKHYHVANHLERYIAAWQKDAGQGVS